MLWLFYLIIEIKSYITYDSGYAASFAWANGYRECWYGDTDILDFVFAGQFERPPQVAMFQSRYNEDYTTPNGYDFQITQITQTKFTAKIYCQYTNGQRTYEIPFYWFAFDDKRVQVISEFNFDVTGYVGTLNIQKTYPHSNPNFNKAIIQVTSFHFKGLLDFTLSVDSITKTDVTISIKSNNINITKVGYQIILGVDSALTIDPQIVTASILYTSPTMTFPTDKDIALTTQGFRWTQLNVNIRIASSFYSNYYTYGCWSPSQTEYLRFTTVYFFKVIKTTYLPMYGKVRVSLIESVVPQTAPYFELKIVELTKVYNYNSPTTEILYIPTNLLKLNLILQYNCPSQQQLPLSIYTNAGKQVNRNFYCQRGGMVVSMYFTFSPTTSAIQELQLIVTKTGISITQKIQNVIVQNVQLMNLILPN